MPFAEACDLFTGNTIVWFADVFTMHYGYHVDTRLCVQLCDDTCAKKTQNDGLYISLKYLKSQKMWGPLSKVLWKK